MSKDCAPAGDDYLPRALTHGLFDLGIAIDLIGHATASRLGINQTDLICLHVLARRGPMTAGQVAATLGLTTAAISAMATRLEAGGYAHREVDPSDRRRVLLHASAAGARHAFSLFDDLYGTVTSFAGGYRRQELQGLVDLLDRFRALIAAQADAIRTEPAGGAGLGGDVTGS